MKYCYNENESFFKGDILCLLLFIIGSILAGDKATMKLKNGILVLIISYCLLVGYFGSYLYVIFTVQNI